MFRNREGRVFGRPSFPLWQRAAVFSLGYFLCAMAGALLSAPGSVNVSFWLPAGLFIAVLLLNPTRAWGWFVLASLPASVAFEWLHEPSPNPRLILIYYAANVCRSVAGAWLVRRFVAERPTLATLKEVFGLMILAGMVSAVVGALVGVLSLTVLGMSHNFLHTWFRWWAGSSMAVLVFSPLLLTWFNQTNGQRGAPWSVARKVEAAALFCGLSFGAWCLLVWGGGVNAPKVPLLVFGLWAGLRFGVRGAAAVIFWLALWTSFLTTHFLKGLSPAEIASGDYIATLQVYLVVAAFVALIPPIIVAERDRAMAKLRDSENRYRSLNEAAYEGVCISENGVVLDMNDQGLKMFGYTRDEMIGKEILDLVGAESRTLVAKAIHAGQELVYGHTARRKDGTVFHAEAQARMVQTGDRRLRMTALRDITERVLAEQSLRESEEKFSKAFRASPDGLAVSELETGRYIEVNEGYCELFGYSREEMLGHTSIELGLWVDVRDRSRLILGLKTARKVRKLEAHMRPRHGGIKFILISAEPIELAGKACLVSALHDITDRIQAERAVCESEEKFSKAFRSSPDAMSISDLATGEFLEVNDGFPSLYGYDREAILGRTSIELGMWRNQADREEMVRRLTLEGSIRNHAGVSRKRSGELFHNLFSAEIVEIKGRACVISVVHDMTAQVRAETALRASEESLRATIDNTPNVAVQWFDRQGRVTFWNHASESLYGWTAAEATGKTLDELVFKSEQAAAFRKIIADIEYSGRSFGPAEFSFRHRSGKTGIVLSTVFQIELASGAPRFVCMDVDLTRRIRAENLGRAQIEVLEMIAAGRSLPETLEALLRMVEAQSSEVLCLVLLLDADGVHIHHGAAPSLPPEYLKTIDGSAIGPCAGSCGTAVFRRAAVFVADIASDPLWADYKACALPHSLRACWSTPIFDGQRQVLGTFAMYSRQPGLPDEAHQQLISMATHTAAVCIGQDRARAERELAVAREQKARIEYTLQLIAAQESERKRIAAELHDSLGQNLLLIKNRAQLALRADSAAAQSTDQLEKISQLASACIAEARQIAHALHPPQLDHLGLTRALEGLVNNLSQSSVLRFTSKFESVDDLFSADAAMNLYRVVQESLNNILKHARARCVDIRLERDIHEVQLRIHDDGIGFNLESPENGKGLGLKNIAGRVRMLGGTWHLDSSPGQGTRLEVTIPIREQPG